MAYLPHTHIALKWPAPPLKRRRRTATSVLAGDFDHRPRVDVLTSLLNGVKPYRPPLSELEIKEREEARERRKALQQEMVEERERKRRARAEKKEQEALNQSMDGRAERNDGKRIRAESQGSSAATSGRSRQERATSFWQALPPRLSVDLMDPTPEPSDDESYSSFTSSKRPHTPFDDDSAHTSSVPLSPQFYSSSARRIGSPKPRKHGNHKKRKLDDSQIPAVAESTIMHPQRPPKESKKRPAVKKGWKGWVEADEDELPRDKLIELDQAVVLHDRRTRSGKNFDAIGEGKDTWV